MPAGIVFVGGFSYADVLESAKGWAGTIRHNESLRSQFQAFYDRNNTWCRCRRRPPLGLWSHDSRLRGTA